MAHWNIYSPVTFPAFGLTIQNLTANALTLLTRTILSEARGFAHVIPFCLILPAWDVAQSITASISHSCHVGGDSATVERRSMASATLRPPNSFDRDAFHRRPAGLVICQLWRSHHAYRKSRTVALHHCLTFAPRTHLPFITYPLFFSLFPVRQTWPAFSVMITITSVCHLFSWVLQYLSHSRHSQKWSWNILATSSQPEGQNHSFWPRRWHDSNVSHAKMLRNIFVIFPQKYFCYFSDCESLCLCLSVISVFSKSE